MEQKSRSKEGSIKNMKAERKSLDMKKNMLKTVADVLKMYYQTFSVNF
jgi:hypothetical protein